MGDHHPHPAARLLAACLAVAFLALLAGCGSDSGSDEPRPLSRRVYIERFNDVQRDTASIFVDVSAATKDPASAKSHLAAIDGLIESIDELRPPNTWKDEHATMLDALRDMRSAIDVLSRAPASKAAIVTTQVGIYTDARDRYEDAVASINETR